MKRVIGIRRKRALLGKIVHFSTTIMTTEKFYDNFYYDNKSGNWLNLTIWSERDKMSLFKETFRPKRGCL